MGGGRLLFNPDRADGILDEGPVPARKPRKRKERWHMALKDSAGPAIDLDSEEEPLPLQDLEPHDPFQRLYALRPPAEQCNRCGGNHASTLCPHFPEERPQHVDALARSPAYTSLHSTRHRGLWQIDGTLFEVGRASGQDTTFCQLLQKPLEHAVAQDALRRKRPEHVDAQTFLRSMMYGVIFVKPWMKTRPTSKSFA